MFDVIAFAAHPDDAETACGGVLIQLGRLGYRTAICDLTRGELGSNGSAEVRAREAEAAAAVLGVAARLQLGLVDGSLDARDPRQAEALLRVLRTHAPRLVIGPDRRARHPDHGETAALLRRAHFFCGVRRVLPELPAVNRPVLLHALDYYPMRASFVVDIQAALATKLAALRCYRSQFERREDDVPTLLNDPAYLERVELQARYYGGLIGTPAGEPFVVDGGVPVVDPIATFATGGEVRP